MLAFGVVGVVLAGLIAVALLGGAVAARNLDERLVADQNRIAASLTRLTLTMETLAVTADHAGGTLTASRDAMTHASDLLADIAATSTDLANALDISILGSQPFASAANGIRNIGAKTTVFAQDATALAVALDANVDRHGCHGQTRSGRPRRRLRSWRPASSPSTRSTRSSGC